MSTIYLRQSTASQEVPLGPYLDETDGVTELTGLTIANTDIQVWKAGATTLANKNSGGATHISDGIYYAVLDATDTDTAGSLVIFSRPAGALPIRIPCVVLTAQVYDSMIAGSDNLEVDATLIGGSSAAGAIRSAVGLSDNNLGDLLDYLQDTIALRIGTAQSGASTTITLDAGASSTDSYYVGSLVALISGTGAGQARNITAYVGSTKVATVPAWTTNPDNTTVFAVLPRASVDGGLDAAGVRSAVGLTSADLDSQLSTIDSNVDAILADTGTDGVLIAANAISDDQLHTNAVNEIRNAITGGAYALDTDANGRVRIVDGTGAGELDTSSGKVSVAADGINAASFASDVDAEILSYLVDDSTRIDASALNTATATTIPGINTKLGTPPNLGGGADFGNNFTDIDASLTGIAGSEATIVSMLRLTEGTIGSTGNDTTHLHLTGLAYTDDELVDHLLVFHDDSTGEYHTRWITDWVNSTALATLDSALPDTPENATDTYRVLTVRRDWVLPSVAANTDGGLPTVDLNGRVAADLEAVDGTDDDITAFADFCAQLGNGLFTGMTSLPEWLGLMAGKQAGDSTARTELRATGAGSGTFDETADSLEALRDRGDSAWVTAAGFSTLDAAGVRSAVGLDSANLDTQLADLPTVAEFEARTIAAASYALEASVQAMEDTVDIVHSIVMQHTTDILSISEDTTSLVATAGNIEADTQDIQNRLPATLVSGRMDCSVGAMAANVVTASALATDAAQEIADTLLARNVSNVESSAGEHTLCTIVLAMLEHSISEGTMTIYRTDGSTTHATKTLTSSSGAEPITGIS